RCCWTQGTPWKHTLHACFRSIESVDYRTIRLRTQVSRSARDNENAFRDCSRKAFDFLNRAGFRLNVHPCAVRGDDIPGSSPGQALSSLAGVALLELVDAAARGHHLLLAGVERVRGRRDIDLAHGVFVAIFPLDGFVARHRRTREEREVGRGVLEN